MIKKQKYICIFIIHIYNITQLLLFGHQNPKIVHFHWDPFHAHFSLSRSLSKISQLCIVICFFLIIKTVIFQFQANPFAIFA